MTVNVIQEKVEKYCQDCGAKLGPGRSNKKFCDNYCRVNFANQKAKEKRELANEGKKENPADPELSVPEYIARIQGIQLKNRKILEGLCDEDRPRRISMRDLLGRDFNPKFFTSQAEPTDKGHIYRFCFEYGYREDSDGKAVVICRKREVEY